MRAYLLCVALLAAGCQEAAPPPMVPLDLRESVYVGERAPVALWSLQEGGIYRLQFDHLCWAPEAEIIEQLEIVQLDADWRIIEPAPGAAMVEEEGAIRFVGVTGGLYAAVPKRVGGVGALVLGVRYDCRTELVGFDSVYDVRTPADRAEQLFTSYDLEGLNPWPYQLQRPRLEVRVPESEAQSMRLLQWTVFTPFTLQPTGPVGRVELEFQSFVSGQEQLGAQFMFVLNREGADPLTFGEDDGAHIRLNNGNSLISWNSQPGDRVQVQGRVTRPAHLSEVGDHELELVLVGGNASLVSQVDGAGPVKITPADSERDLNVNPVSLGLRYYSAGRLDAGEAEPDIP